MLAKLINDKEKFKGSFKPNISLQPSHCWLKKAHFLNKSAQTDDDSPVTSVCMNFNCVHPLLFASQSVAK